MGNNLTELPEFKNADEQMQKLIRKEMGKLFYIEGKDKDYYFDQLFDCLTVFYNDLGNEAKTNKLKSNVDHTISSAFSDMVRNHRLYSSFNHELDLARSAINIPFVIQELSAQKDYDYYYYYINYGKSGVVEKSQEEEAERWEVCKSRIDEFIHQHDNNE